MEYAGEVVWVINIANWSFDSRIRVGNARWIRQIIDFDPAQIGDLPKQILRRIRRLLMKIPFDIPAAASIDLSCGLPYPLLINTSTDEIVLPCFFFIMALGFDHRAIRFTAVVKTLWFSRRWISKAKSEPRGQRRRLLRIDDAADILLILNIESLTPVYVFRAWIWTKFWLLALGFRLRLGASASFCARIVLLLFLRSGRSTHRVWINDDAAPGRAGNRRAGLVAKDAILSKMGGSDGLIARRAALHDDKRAFLTVEAVVQAGLPRHGALRRDAAIRRRNENEAEGGSSPRKTSGDRGKACKRLSAERAKDRAFGRGAGCGLFRAAQHRAAWRAGIRPR